MNGMAASDKIFKILDSDEREVITSGKRKKLDLSERVEVALNDVSFSYDGERKVLKHINMNITPGGVVAIVGESGSGKSTVASLILNTYKVTLGKITINEDNVNEMNIEDIYNKISLVSTNSYIFNGTLLYNLLMSSNEATMKEVDEALRIARLDDFVRGLKDGINTKVGEGGSLLSGGQKQRLALARVILGNRNMIIFDEATSNIDVNSEEYIWQAIYDLSKSRTILVISHRLANVKEGKKIYVVGFFIPYLSSSMAKEAGAKYRKDFGESNSYILDSLRGLKDILLFNNGEERINRIHENSIKLNKSLHKIKKHEGIIRANRYNYNGSSISFYCTRV